MSMFAKQRRLSFISVGQFLPTAKAGGFPAEEQEGIFDNYSIGRGIRLWMMGLFAFWVADCAMWRRQRSLSTSG
jgi:hypothetical protein